MAEERAAEEKRLEEARKKAEEEARYVRHKSCRSVPRTTVYFVADNTPLLMVLPELKRRPNSESCISACESSASSRGGPRRKRSGASMPSLPNRRPCRRKLVRRQAKGTEGFGDLSLVGQLNLFFWDSCCLYNLDRERKARGG